jgi:selenium metabolism protein YedF
MQIVDTSGQLCPAPLIATKRALRNTKTGESFIVITDNKTSFNNIIRFLKDNNAKVSYKESDGVWQLSITRSGTGNIDLNPEEYCTVEIPHFSTGDFIIAFKSDKMGDGDDELGHLLMNNFIKAIKDLDILPIKMVFYNSGIKLGSDDSPVVDHLIQLEKMGVSLLFCGTCINHYSMENKIKIGIISNMFEIVQAMASASNIVNP